MVENISKEKRKWQSNGAYWHRRNMVFNDLSLDNRLDEGDFVISEKR
jgi:hypothetical protein